MAKTGSEQVQFSNDLDSISVNYAINLDGVYLPSQNALIPYESLLTSWESALTEYAKNPDVLANDVEETKDDVKEANYNFLNMELEQLMDVPVDPNRETTIQVVQQGREGFVLSQAREFEDNDGLEDDKRVLSESRNLFFIEKTSVPEVTTQPVIVDTGPPTPPNAPGIIINNEFSSERFLNTGPIVFSGNVFNFGASFAGTGIGLNAAFQDNTGTTLNIDAQKITLTSEEGNTLKIYRSTGAGHVRGDFEYTLNHAILTPPNDSITLGGQIFYQEKFFYSLTNAQFLTTVGTLVFQISDDQPVATDQSGLDSLDEANIANGGSNDLSTAHQLAGSLIHPSVNPLPAGLSDNRIGPDGGSVSDVTLVGVQGADIVTGNTAYGNAFTLADLSFLQANGFVGSKLSDPVTVVQDSLGNLFKVNTLTGHYIYVLNGAFHHDQSDSTSQELFRYEFTDNEGQTAEAIITFTVQDDAPIANDFNAGSLDEANLNQGSNPNLNALELSGSLLNQPGVLPSTFGADGGVISRITFDGQDYIPVLDNNNEYMITIPDLAGNELVVNSFTGTYKFTLFDNNNYDNTGNADWVNIYQFYFTDSDFSEDSGILTLSIHDDVPIANDFNAGTLNEASLSNGSNSTGPLELTGNLLNQTGVLPSTFGADDGSVSKITYNGYEYLPSLNNNNQKLITIVDVAGNELIVNADSADYVFTLSQSYSNFNNTDWINNYVFTFTDSDDSEDSGTLTLSIQDDAPIANDVNAGTLDEASLSNGSASNANALSLSGSLLSTFGADGGSVSKITYNGQDYTPELDNNNQYIIIVADEAGNELVVYADTAQYNFTLSFNYENKNDVDWINQYTFTFEDSDHSTDSAVLSLSIRDDHPFATNVDAGTVYEANLSDGSTPYTNGTILTGTLMMGAATLGADGGSITEIIFNGNTYFASNNKIEVEDDRSFLTVNAITGAYTYTLLDNHTHSGNADEFSYYDYTITDGDGSTSSATITVRIVDDSPVVDDINAGTLAEANLSNGSSSTNPGPLSLNGSLLGTFGADGGTISKITYNGNDNLAILGWITVYDVAGNELLVNENTADFVFTLSQNYNNINNADWINNYSFTFTDTDGSEDSAVLTITIQDDTPVSNPIDHTISEEDTPFILLGDLFDLSAANTLGADHPGTILLDFNSLTNASNVTVGPVENYVITGEDLAYLGSNALAGDSGYRVADDIGNVFILDAQTGTYYYSLNANFSNDVIGSPVVQTFTYTIQDSDGSVSAPNTLTISIEDEQIATFYTPTIFTDESDLDSYDFNGGSFQDAFDQALNNGLGLSLRELVILSNHYDWFGNDANKIILENGTYELSLVLINEVGSNAYNEFKGDLDVTSHLTINGFSTDYGDSIISANQISRIFDLPESGHLIVKNLTVRDGLETTPETAAAYIGGGGLRSFGILDMDNVRVTENTITIDSNASANIGGGVYISAGSILNSVVDYNTIDSAFSFGAGIAAQPPTSSSPITISNTLVDNNLITNSYNSTFFFARGAGIEVSGADIVTITDSTISNNRIEFENDSATTVDARGAGLDLTQRALFTNSTVVENEILVNTTINIGETTSAYGGGLYFNTFLNEMTNITISDNRIDASGMNVSVKGGGMYFDNGVAFLASSSHLTVVNNEASASNLSGGTASALGGGVYFEADTYPPISSSIVLGNVQIVNSLPTPMDMYAFAYYGGSPLLGQQVLTQYTNANIIDYISSDYITTFGSNTLADNGGFTQTVALAPGSLAIDAGIASALGADQRDAPYVNTADIGAYEYNGVVPPVVLDLNNDGVISLLSPSQSMIQYAYGTVGWVAPEEGILMYDPLGTGQFTDLNQIAFTGFNEHARTDLEGLIAFDTNKNGLLDLGDQQYNQFGVWQDKNTNARTDADEFHNLTFWNIQSIHLTSNQDYHINNGNIVYGLSEYQTVDGKSHVLADVGLTIAYHDVIQENVLIDSPPAQLIPITLQQSDPTVGPAVQDIQFITEVLQAQTQEQITS